MSVQIKREMARHHISKELRRFLKEKIQTVLRLEILLLMHNHQRRAFTSLEVADRLGLENDETKLELGVLEAIGVVRHFKHIEAKYKYLPVDANLGSMVEQLAIRYSRQRVSVLSVILAEHPDRTRLFTEAFKLIRGHN